MRILIQQNNNSILGLDLDNALIDSHDVVHNIGKIMRFYQQYSYMYSKYSVYVYTCLICMSAYIIFMFENIHDVVFLIDAYIKLKNLIYIFFKNYV